MISQQKIIYVTEEINSDGKVLKHNGLKKIGIGQTYRVLYERYKEHHNRGSKSTTGVRIIGEIPVRKDISDKDIHNKLISLGYFPIKRSSEYDKITLFSKTEVYCGNSNKSIPWVVKKGDELDIKIIKNIIKEKDPDVFKNELKLKHHQQESIDFINSRYDVGETDVLLNHKARSGKSFISYYFLINNKYGIKNTLLLTQYPILNGQWKNELENIKGHNINVINCSDLIDNHKIVKLETDRPNLVMISLQDAKGNEDVLDDNDIVDFLNKQKFDELKNVQWDLIIFDEVHKGKETKKTDFLLSKLNYKKLLGLSATPTKNLLRGTFKLENVHVYDLVSERKFREQYGRTEYNIPDIRFNLMYCDDIKNELSYFKEEEYFTFKKFFRVDDGKLRYYDDIKLFFSWVFGVGGRFRDNALDNIIGRADIENILIFVETNECQELLVNCLEDIGGKFDGYNIIYTNSTVKNSSQLLRMINGIDNTPGKSIIFANKQLTTGITLRKCDIVMFMNDWKNMDEYIQASYRCQSPSTTKRKLWTNVFDFNPSRSFNILYEYIRNSTINKSYNFEESIREFLKCANVNLYESGQFRAIDFESFYSNVVKSFDLDKKNIFRLVSNNIDISDISDNLKKEIVKFGDYSITKPTSKNTKLNEDAEDSGQSTIEEKQKNKTEESIEESKEKLIDTLLNNIEYIIGKTPSMSIFSYFSCNSIDELFNYLDNNTEQKKLYINSLLLSTELDNDTIFNIIKDLYNSLNIKNKLDDILLIFNKKYNDVRSSYIENYDIIMYIEKVIQLIDSYIGISESEKKLLGEVFTPFHLIDEMLDTLPSEVWSNPNLKWLDPANGIGNFPILIVKRLLVGLIDFEPDYKKRFKHIMENMMYVCDINPKNMFIYNNLFNPNDDLKLNTYCNSFLNVEFDNHMKNNWKINGFDIIVGNPPYQEQKGSNEKSQSLWNIFIEKDFSILNTNGYLCQVHPSGWRNSGGHYYKIQEIIKNKQVLYLSIQNENKGLKVFGSETRFDFYTLCNLQNNNFITEVKGQDDKISKIDLSKLQFIPNNNFDIFEKLLAKNDEDKVNIISDSSYHTQRNFLSKEKINDFIYPCIYTVKSNDVLTMWWSKININGHFGISKLVWSNFRIISAGSFIDINGEYGLTQFSYGIIDKVENLTQIKKVFDSKKFRNLMESCSISDMKINPKVISLFRKDFWKDDYFNDI